MSNQNQASNPNKQNQNQARNPQSQTQPGQNDTYANQNSCGKKSEPGAVRSGNDMERGEAGTERRSEGETGNEQALRTSSNI